LEERIEDVKSKVKERQSIVTHHEKSLQRLSHQQDEGMMECSEHIIYHVAGKFGEVLIWQFGSQGKYQFKFCQY